jgi:predicted nucleotidyltransferase component of viral defense system
MTDLRWETITPLMRQMLQTVGRSELCPRFYLAGGTALALQLGHRQSVDLDFFSETDEVRPEMHQQAVQVLKAFQPTIVEQAWGNLLLVVENLRVGFFGYGYPLVAPPTLAEGVPLASLADIGLMKMDAVATRASRKDFHDLYAITRRISLRALFDLAPAKYPSVRDFEAMVVRAMVYFDRADQEEALPLLQPVDWETVKAFFREQALALGKEWLE